MLLLISYDLSTSDRPARYEDIDTEIRASATSVSRPLYSQWLVESDQDVNTWSQRLTQFLTPADRLLVVRVQGPTNGWLPPDFWAWINSRAT